MAAPAVEKASPDEVVFRVVKDSKSLMMSHMHMEKEGAVALAGVLNKCPQLEWLDLWNNQIGDDGLKPLCEQLAKTGLALKSLNIASNNITPKGIQYLAKMLEKVQKLEVLLIYDNPIGDEGMKTLAEALMKSGKYIKQLHVASTGITKDGVLPLIAALPQLGSLEKFWLGPNPLGDEGLNIVCNGLQLAGSLQLLHVDDVKATDAGVQLLVSAVTTCPSLTKVSAKGNQEVPPALIKTLQAAADANKAPERVKLAADRRAEQRKKLKLDK